MGEQLDEIRDINLVQRCLEGDTESILELQRINGPYLRAVLTRRGASESEADEILAAIWADCLAGDTGRVPLFHRFDGRSILQPWLAAIAINRWISRKRHEKVRHEVIEELRALQESESLSEGASDGLVDPVAVEIVGQALRNAFRECDPEDLVILQLVHGHGLTRREVAVLWACHESSVGRRLATAEEKIADSTRRFIKEMEPAFELGWSDILAFSESAYRLLS